MPRRSSVRRTTSSRRSTIADTKSCRPSALRRTIGVKLGVTPGSNSTSNRRGRRGLRSGLSRRRQPSTPMRAPVPRPASTESRHRPTVPGGSCSPAALAPFNASANSVAVCQRSAGSFSSAFAIASLTCGGTDRRCSTIGRASSAITLPRIAVAVRTGERRLPGEHLVGHHTEAIDIASRIEPPDR